VVPGITPSSVIAGAFAQADGRTDPAATTRAFGGGQPVSGADDIIRTGEVTVTGLMNARQVAFPAFPEQRAAATNVRRYWRQVPGQRTCLIGIRARSSYRGRGFRAILTVPAGPVPLPVMRVSAAISRLSWQLCRAAAFTAGGGWLERVRSFVGSHLVRRGSSSAAWRGQQDGGNPGLPAVRNASVKKHAWLGGLRGGRQG